MKHFLKSLCSFIHTILVITVINVRAEFKGQTNVIPVALLVPKPHTDGGCTRAVMEMAIEDVNAMFNTSVNRESHRRGIAYKIKGYFKEIGSTNREAVRALNELYRTSPTKLATIGVPYQSQNAFVLDFIYQSNFPYFSYSLANLPMGENFGTYIQVSTFLREQFHAAVGLMNHFYWTHYSLVVDMTNPLYDEMSDLFIELMPKRAPGLSTTERIYGSLPNENSAIQVKNIHNARSRVNFALTGVYGARKIFCESFKRKMYKQKIIWVLFETLPPNWASDDYNNKINGNGEKVREIECTPTQLHTAADGYVSIVKQDFRRDNARTVSGFTIKEFYSEKLKLLNSKLRLDSTVKCATKMGLLYDTVWLVAKMFSDFNQSRDVYDYVYDEVENKFDRQYSRDFMATLSTTQFEGVTGRIKFTKLKQHKSHFTYNGREGPSDIWVNHANNSKDLLAQYNNKTSSLLVEPNANILLFGTRENLGQFVYAKLVQSPVSYELQLIFIALPCVGILLAQVVLVAVVIYAISKKRYMKLITIELPIIFGCILSLISVILYGMETKRFSTYYTQLVYSCYAFLSCFLIGYSLTFSALLVDTWHLYKKYVTSGVKVEDNGMVKIKGSHPIWLLYFPMFVFVGVEIIFLVVLGTVSPLRTKALNISEHFSETGQKEIVQIFRCTCSDESKFVIAMYCYKGVLLLFGVFIAWQTKIKTKKLQLKGHTKDIAIYNIASISVIGVICFNALKNANNLDAEYAVVALCIIIGTTTTLLLVFYEKLWRFMVTVFQCMKNRSNEKLSNQSSTSSSSPDSIAKTATKKTTSVSSNELQGMEKSNSLPGSSDISSSTSFMVPPSYSNGACCFGDEQDNEACDGDSLSRAEQGAETKDTVPLQEKHHDEKNSAEARGVSQQHFSPFVSQTSFTDANETLEEETVNDDGILSTSGIYVGDNSIYDGDNILPVDNFIADS